MRTRRHLNNSALQLLTCQYVISAHELTIHSAHELWKKTCKLLGIDGNQSALEDKNHSEGEDWRELYQWILAN